MHNDNSHRLSLSFPILIADIGGTNARFAIIADGDSQPAFFATVKTADFNTIDEAIKTSVLDKTSYMPRAAVLAIAGPIDGDEIDLTNNHWVVKPKTLIKSFDFQDIVVLNDYEAQALAVIALDKAQLKKIGGGVRDDNANCVVIGPGTGLGVAGLVHAAGSWIPIAGEGGHVDLGPRTDRDSAIFGHLERIGGRVSGEQILCGRGLVNLYQAVAKASGIAPQFDSPEQVTAAAIDGNDAIASETMSLFCEYLGRVAGDLALIFMARGGVYLTGGITQKILSIFDEERFRAGFENKEPHADILSQMPTFAILHEQAPMVGLAAYACEPSRFAVSLDRRHWQ